jgi:Na+-driven multidrug efflux pump
MLTRKHLLNVIILGAPLLVGMVSEFFMYMADSAMVGRLGTEHLAAIGTALALTLGAVFLLAYVTFSRKLRVYRCCRFRSIRWQLMKDIIVVSSPMIVQLGVSLCIFLYYESIIAGIGTVYLAVTHIVITTFVLNRSLVEGFAEGGSILIGNHLGRNDRQEALQYAYATECIALCLGAVLLILVLMFPEMIVRIFNSEPETVSAGVKALRFSAGFLFISTIGFPLEVIFTHNGWGRYALVAEIFPIVIFTLGLTLLVVKYYHMEIYAAWFSLGLYMITYSALLIGGFFSKRWLEVSVESDLVRD